jgi:hypothetical protein
MVDKEEPYDFALEFQTDFIPRQKPALDPVPDSMKASVAIYPPLEQVTKLEAGKVVLTALLEVHESRNQEEWQMSLWHSTDGQHWTETLLQRADEYQMAVQIQQQPSQTVRYHFVKALEFQASMQFTVKIRGGKHEEWRWVRDEQGLGDGILIIQSQAPGRADSAENLQDIIKDLNPAWTAVSILSQSPATSLWSLQTTVDAADGENSTFRDIPLGIPWGKFLRWFALVRIWTPWLAPRHGKSTFELDKDAILCSFLNPEGRHLVLLAISGANNVLSVFRHNESGGINVHVAKLRQPHLMPLMFIGPQ